MPPTSLLSSPAASSLAFFSSLHNLSHLRIRGGAFTRNPPPFFCLFYSHSPKSRMEAKNYYIAVIYSASIYFSLSVVFSGPASCVCEFQPGTCRPGCSSAEYRPELLSLPEKSFWTGRGIVKNKAMVEHLQNYGVVSSKKVAEVMEQVDRALFIPEGSPPYVDSPMPIGYNATISAPHMHATCLELLKNHLQPGMHALDVGSGTGYLTACFAMMVGPQGRAVGVEHIPELVAISISNLEKSVAAPLLKGGALSVHTGDGRLGWPEHAPYDAIHVGAAASEIPKPLLDQLKPGGRMVIPVGNIFQDLKVVDKKSDGSISVRAETSVRYVPLTSREAQLRGF